MLSFKLNRLTHKWLSLFVGVQLLIWIGTGLYFNLMDHDKATGNTLRVHSHHEDNITDFELVNIKDLDSEPALALELIWVLRHPYYHIVYEKGAHNYQQSRSIIFDALTGKPFELLPSHITEIAQNSYSGSGKLLAPVLKPPPFSDYAGQQNLMWKVEVDDENDTTIYIDSTTGQVIRHVNKDSRLKELMMKLHFMDYMNTGGFNHWLIIICAIATLMFSITGVTWLTKLYRNGQLRFRLTSNRQRKKHRN